jgi:hypothetical protein
MVGKLDWTITYDEVMRRCAGFDPDPNPDPEDVNFALTTACPHCGRKHRTNQTFRNATTGKYIPYATCSHCGRWEEI